MGINVKHMLFPALFLPSPGEMLPGGVLGCWSA